MALALSVQLSGPRCWRVFQDPLTGALGGGATHLCPSESALDLTLGGEAASVQTRWRRHLTNYLSPQRRGHARGGSPPPPLRLRGLPQGAFAAASHRPHPLTNGPSHSPSSCHSASASSSASAAFSTSPSEGQGEGEGEDLNAQDERSDSPSFGTSTDGSAYQAVSNLAPSPTASLAGAANPVLEDVRRKAPHWGSDIRDGLHPQAVAAVAFLAFACLTPCIAFGSLTAAQTGGAIGVVETILGTAASGVVYALLSGQPLTLLGPTGLVVVFTGLLHKASASLGLPFLPVYGWVSVWSAVFLAALALAGASDLIHLFTRFTDDTFSVLISLGFISEACKSLSRQFSTLTVLDPTTGHADISSPLLSAVVAVGTWLLSSSLTQRNSSLFTSAIRSFLSDFGPPIAIVTMSVLPRVCFPNTPLPTLAPPSTSASASASASLASALATTTGRPWLVPLASLPPWAMAACSIPAALLTLLVFLDQNITTRLLDAPENGLRKGCGYHLDLLILALLMLLSAAVGAPWMVASTVPSLAHVRSLSLSAPPPPAVAAPPAPAMPAPESSSPSTAPAPAAASAAAAAAAGAALAGVDDVSPSPGVGVATSGGTRENRVTALAIHVAVGASALLLPLLALVPSAVAQGLFIFMGLSGLANNQLVERVQLWLCDPNKCPSLPFTTGIPMSAVHAFTALQVSCLALLWQLKHSKWGIFFPLLILALMPIRRFIAPLFLSETELRVLDSH